jgi:hypothetical protein
VANADDLLFQFVLDWWLELVALDNSSTWLVCKLLVVVGDDPVVF